MYSYFWFSVASKWNRTWPTVNGGQWHMNYTLQSHWTFNIWNCVLQTVIFKQLTPKKHESFGIKIIICLKPRHEGLRTGKGRKCVAQIVHEQITSRVIWRLHIATINCCATESEETKPERRWHRHYGGGNLTAMVWENKAKWKNRDKCAFATMRG